MQKLFLTLILFIMSIPSYSKEPWDSLLVNDRKVSLNMNKKPVSYVNSWFTKASGIAIISDPNFNVLITLDSPTKLNLSDCFSMYSSILNMYNYEFVKENKWLIIKPKSKEILKPIITDDKTQNQTNNVISVYSIKNNSASNIAKILNEIFAPTPSIDEIIKRINSNDTVRPGGQN